MSRHDLVPWIAPGAPRRLPLTSAGNLALPRLRARRITAAGVVNVLLHVFGGVVFVALGGAAGFLVVFGVGRVVTLRFYRRINIIPGLRLNLSKTGVSASIGHRGAWLTFGPRGRRATIGLPGTGLFWTEHCPPAKPPHAGHRALFLLVCAVIAMSVLMSKV